MEKIITVKSTEMKDGKNGPYLAVSAHDGHIYNIFKEELHELFQDGMAVKITGELKGKYFNTQHAEMVKDALVRKIAAEGGQIVEEKMTKDDWAEKDKITRKSIERQKSLEMAVETLKAGAIKDEQVIPTAKRFEKYLETGE